MAATTEMRPEPLPGGRHSIPPELVVSYQRERLVEASAAVLAERGYARATTTEIAKRARVSTATLYRYHADLWECLAEAYESVAAHLLKGLGAGLGWGLDFLAAEPDFAYLLCIEPPAEAAALRAARRELVGGLATMLRRDGDGAAGDGRPTGREGRLVAAALALVAAQVTAGRAETLPELEPQLKELLAAPSRA